MPKPKTKRTVSTKKASSSPKPKKVSVARRKPGASRAKRSISRSSSTSRVVKKSSSPKVAGGLLGWLKRNQQWLAVLVFIIGLNLVLASGWYLLYRRTVLSFQVSPSVTSEIKKAAPTHISVMGINAIEAPVTQGEIKEGIWEVSDTSVVHLQTSAYPGQAGNIIMYGHNTKNLFKLLPTVKVGDTITVQTESEELHVYRVNEVLTVKPTEIEVVLPTDHEVLTVYTCTGWFDSLRFVVKATPVTS